MKFLSIYKSAKPEGIPPTQGEMEQMGALVEEWKSAGVLLAAEGCLPSATGARVRQTKGKVSVTDGPFTESKEIIGGFALMEVESKQNAVELIQRFLTLAGDGECEIRQIYGD